MQFIVVLVPLDLVFVWNSQPLSFRERNLAIKVCRRIYQGVWLIQTPAFARKSSESSWLQSIMNAAAIIARFPPQSVFHLKLFFRDCRRDTRNRILSLLDLRMISQGRSPTILLHHNHRHSFVSRPCTHPCSRLIYPDGIRYGRWGFTLMMITMLVMVVKQDTVVEWVDLHIPKLIAHPNTACPYKRLIPFMFIPRRQLIHGKIDCLRQRHKSIRG